MNEEAYREGLSRELRVVVEKLEPQAGQLFVFSHPADITENGRAYLAEAVIGLANTFGIFVLILPEQMPIAELPPYLLERAGWVRKEGVGT
jgi:hypothetical protein